jgi:transcriptional regulator with XRE-family HTH domain
LIFFNDYSRQGVIGMNSELLGKRLREARLSRRMTQADVAAGFITRNMLSQIESGTANPSIKTLEHLSKMLGLPMAELLPEGEGDFANAVVPSAPLDVLTLGKSRLSKGDFAGAIDCLGGLCYEGGVLYDEACALLARAYLGQSSVLRDNERLRSAKVAAEHALRLSQLGIYAQDSVNNIKSIAERVLTLLNQSE